MFYKFFSTVALLSLTASSLVAVEAKEMSEAERIQKISETFGNILGKSIQELSKVIPYNTEALISGIRKGIQGEPAPLTEEEYEEQSMQFRQKFIDEQAKENLEKAENFLKAKAKEKGVIELEKEKLYYQIVTEGKGAPLTATSSPTIDYSGSFIDGKVFSKSQEGEPITLSLERTIPGFSKGLIGAKEGETRRLFIHPDLAYGTHGELPPNSLLIFDVKIIKAETPQSELPEEEISN